MVKVHRACSTDTTHLVHNNFQSSIDEQSLAMNKCSDETLNSMATGGIYKVGADCQPWTAR